jgi:hypothetical protein
MSRGEKTFPVPLRGVLMGGNSGIEDDGKARLFLCLTWVALSHRLIE